MQFPPASSNAGILHYIPPNLSAFEPSKPLVDSETTNTLLWIGGMFDTLMSVAYPFDIAKSLPDWSVMIASLGTAGKSWGIGSIANDAEDMAKIVRFIKQQRPGGKIVIMGHSTGCQDCMEYTVGPKSEQRPTVDGVILQAPVSDREAITAELPKTFLDTANQLALKMCREGKDREYMPYQTTSKMFGRMALTARRWVDVASPGPDHTGADDYFSSDLPHSRIENTFGKLAPVTPILIMYMGSEENVPESIDKKALVARWIQTVKAGGGNVDETNSGIVEGATHNLNGDPEKVVQDLVQRVVGFIGRLDQGDFNVDKPKI